MSDISLLPQDFREKEEELKKEQQPAETSAGEMHVPKEQAEDVEVIEVEEGEVDQILSSEPLLTRLIYQAGVWLEGTRDKLFKRRAPEPPPKLPPQFFQPAKPAAPKAAVGIPPKPATALPTAALPATPAVTMAAPSLMPSGANVPKPKARIIPSSATPRRVRIIKRVHKPVHISLLDENLVRQLQVNIPKRQLTLAFLTVFCAAVFTAAFFLLDQQKANAASDQNAANQELTTLRSQITDLQSKWSAFQDLEPRLMTLNDLMNKHVSVLHVLTFLEQRTLSEVSYAGFLLDSSGQVHMAVTAPSYEAAAKQLQIFKDSPEIKTVDSSAFTYTEASGDNAASVTFQLSLQFQDQALLFEKPLSER